MAVAFHATNVLRATGAVVPVEDYHAVCAARDALAEEVARLREIVRERIRQTVTTGDLTIDLETGDVRKGQDPVSCLSKVERNLITLLALHQGQMVSYADIDRVVWNGEGKKEGIHRVRVNLCRIRRKLADAPSPSSGRVTSRSRYFETYPLCGIALR